MLETWKSCLAASWQTHGDLFRAKNMYVTPSCSSTMDVARTLCESGRFPEWACVAAVRQTRGRGQAGRTWNAGEGNLYTTIRLPDALRAITLLPLALGLIICRRLEALGAALQIKWPNDLLMGGCKVGGILVEARNSQILAGIGINVNQSPDSAGFRIPGASCKDFGMDIDAPTLCCQLLADLKENLERITAHPGLVITSLEKRLAYLDQDVVLSRSGQPDTLVRILGLTREGGLKILERNTTQILWSGRISPRTL